MIIDGSAVNVAPVIDPVGAVVCAADVSNVKTVLVDGEILKDDFRLAGLARRAAQGRRGVARLPRLEVRRARSGLAAREGHRLGPRARENTSMSRPGVPSARARPLVVATNVAWWYITPVPFPVLSGRRQAVRRDRMQARPAAAARPEFSVHPLTPLSERDRGRRPGRRIVTLAVAALALAVAVPVLGAALAPAAPSLSPLAGEVAGAAGQPSATPAEVAAQGPAVQGPAARVPLLAVAHPADAEGPAHRAFGPPEAPPASSLTGYQWPISVGRITLPFKEIPGGEFSRNGKLFHDGVDMASFCGDRSSAAHDGVVLAAGRHFDDCIGWVGDLGPYYKRLDAKHLWNELPIVVVIDDGNGYRSDLRPLPRRDRVKRGQHVHAGQLIGYEGATGHASAATSTTGCSARSRPRSSAVRAGRRQADEGAALRDRPDRPAARPAGPSRPGRDESPRPSPAGPSRSPIPTPATGASSAPAPVAPGDRAQ